ncbi:MAG: HDOD domain-containing protein [Gammaproteobacteria bacterium]
MCSAKCSNPEVNLPNFLSGSFLPSPPEIMQNIRRVTPDLDQIAKVITADMGLSASILKTINSPFYGMRSNIISIQQAVALLGLDSVMNIVNAHLLLTVLKADDYSTNLDDFWELSSEIAGTCIVVANHLDFFVFDDVYTLGLFHNAGIPLMVKQFPDYMTTLQTAYQQSEQRITDIENQNYDTNHAVVGYFLAKGWKLPDNLRAVIRDHHNLEHLTTGLKDQNDTNMMMVILKISEYLVGSQKVLGELEINHEWEIIKHSLLDYLGYSEPDFEELEDAVHDSMAMV